MKRMLSRKPLTIFIAVSAMTLTSFAQTSSQQTKKSRTTKVAAPKQKPKPPTPPPAPSVQNDQRLAKARSLAASGQYQEASKILFQLTRLPQYARDSSQIKYILGLMLFEMRLNQSAAFVFYDVVHQESHNTQNKYLKQSLEKLALAADSLNSDVLLRYAIKQVRPEEFPSASRDMLAFRTGEIKMQEKDFAGASREFVKVQPASLFFNRARYQMALAMAEANQADKALAIFEDLARRSESAGTTDPNRVNALMGKARVLYQKQNFEGAIEAYRDIPRDTEQWHESLFESSWAMLRDGRFRSALSNFHTLHSPYYEDFYQPESLFLRAIVYLYICRYEETGKVLDLFERVYKPVQRDVHNILTTSTDPLTYYREVSKIADRFDAIRSGSASRGGFQIPFIVAREVLKEGDVRRTFNYLQNLASEKHRIEIMPAGWKTSGVGQYAKKIVEKRIEATQVLAGKQIRRHLLLIQDELRDLFEQTGFLRFEMISSKKESLRKEIQGKGLERQHVDENTARDYYIQNGYDYWPFKGEYWLDEIGNYHYVGVKACE